MVPRTTSKLRRACPARRSAETSRGVCAECTRARTCVPMAARSCTEIRRRHTPQHRVLSPMEVLHPEGVADHGSRGDVRADNGVEEPPSRRPDLAERGRHEGNTDRDLWRSRPPRSRVPLPLAPLPFPAPRCWRAEGISRQRRGMVNGNIQPQEPPNRRAREVVVAPPPRPAQCTARLGAQRHPVRPDERTPHPQPPIMPLGVRE